MLHAHEEIDGDGIWPRYARVEIHGTRHAAEVGVAVDGGHFSSAAVVVAKDDLNEVDIRDRLQLHFKLAHPAVALFIEDEAVEVFVDVQALLVASKEFFGLIEGMGKARGGVRRGVHRLASVGRDMVVGRLLVDAYTLHAVGGIDGVPGQDVPIAEIVASPQVVATDGVAIGGGVGTAGDGAREVSAHIEGLRLRIADGAEERAVGVVPSVEPFCLPVVFNVVLEQIVPHHVQVEVDGGHHRADVGASLVEVEHRLALTARHGEAEESEAKTLKAVAGFLACSQQAIG